MASRTEFLFRAPGKVTAPFFTEAGKLMPLDRRHLGIPSRPELARHYNMRYTVGLLRDVQRQITDMELFLELHRRAWSYYARTGKLFAWDNCMGGNEIILREYDRRYGDGS